MSLTEALSKLHEILSVLIGESADEWRAQKQSTCFTSEWEWARHLLSIHKTCCKENNCFLTHNEECAAENHTSVKQPKNEFTTHPRPMEQIFPNSLVIRNTISQQRFAKRRRCRFKGLSHSSAAKRSIASPKSKISDNSDRTSMAESDSIVKRSHVSSKEEPMLLNDVEVCLAEDEGLVPSSSHNRVSVKREPIEDVVVVDSDDDLEQRYDHTATELPISVLATNPWTTTSGAYSSDACQDAGYTITTATGDESWQFSAASENDLMQAGYNEGVDDSYYDEAMYVVANVKQEPVDESVGPGHSNTTLGIDASADELFDYYPMLLSASTQDSQSSYEMEKNHLDDHQSRSLDLRSKNFNHKHQSDPSNFVIPSEGNFKSPPGILSSVSSVERNSWTGRYKCPLCPNDYISRSALKDHIHRHAGIKPYMCTICGAGFTQYATLYNHKNNHRVDWFRCAQCQWQTKSFQAMQKHKRWHSKMQ